MLLNNINLSKTHAIFSPNLTRYPRNIHVLSIVNYHKTFFVKNMNTVERVCDDEPIFWSNRLRVVSNFGDGDCGAGEIHTRARTIAIAKIRDYSQSIGLIFCKVFELIIILIVSPSMVSSY